MSDNINHRQLMAMAFISLLSPMIRLVPKLTSQLGGRSSWLSVIPASAGAAILIYIVYRLVKNRNQTQGLSDFILCTAGKKIGTVLCVLCWAWLTIYAGFVLRTGAERLISCVYPQSSLGAIVIVMLLLAVPAACGRAKSLAGTATVLSLIIVTLLIIAVAFALPGVKLENLLPVAEQDVGGIFTAALPVFNVLCGGVYFLFLFGCTKKETVRSAGAVKCTLALSAVALMIIVVTVGTFSAQLTSSFQYPFFTLMRNIQILRIVERFEAVIIVVWICADFIYLSSLLLGVRKIWGSITGRESKISVFVSAGAALGVCYALGRSAFDVNMLSERYIPVINVAFAAVFVPVLLIIGRLRKKI